MNKQDKKPKSMGKTAIIGQHLTSLGVAASMGTTKKKNAVVNYLLLSMAKLTLASLAPDDKLTRLVQDAAAATRGKLQASHTDEELAPINLMADTAVAMAKKLAACDDVAQLEASLEYMKKLLAGEVYVMEDVETPEDHGLQPNQ